MINNLIISLIGIVILSFAVVIYNYVNELPSNVDNFELNEFLILKEREQNLKKDILTSKRFQAAALAQELKGIGRNIELFDENIYRLQTRKDSELLTLGYTKNQISCIRTFDETDEMRAKVAAVLTGELSLNQRHRKHSTNKCMVKVVMNFSWKGVPGIAMEDAFTIEGVARVNQINIVKAESNLTYADIVDGQIKSHKWLEDVRNTQEGTAISYAVPLKKAFGQSLQSAVIKKGTLSYFVEANENIIPMDAVTTYSHKYMEAEGGINFSWTTAETYEDMALYPLCNVDVSHKYQS